MIQESPTVIATPVWDWPVRAVHWAIVLLVIGLVTTGLIGNEMLVWHMRMGQALLALVLFRVLWGFFGSPYARFGSFLHGPGPVVSYVRSVFRPPHETHATHNPIGGWMVIALLVAMLFQAGSGLFTNDDILADGPLVRHISKDLSDSISSLHRRGWWVVVGLSVVHILAVASYLVLFRENLVYPMFHGRKSLPAGTVNAASAHASTPRALILLALSAAFVWWIVNRL